MQHKIPKRGRGEEGYYKMFHCSFLMMRVVYHIFGDSGAQRDIYVMLALARDHEPRRLAERRSAAGMSRRRFDLKVEWDTSRPSFDILFSDDLRQTSPAIPTCGSRQAP